MINLTLEVSAAKFLGISASILKMSPDQRKCTRNRNSLNKLWKKNAIEITVDGTKLS